MMQRRKFLQYTAASGASLLGGSYWNSTAWALDNPVHNTGTPMPTQAVAGMPETPLYIPGNKGLLGILDVTDEKLTLKAHSTQMPLLGGKTSPFLVFSGKYGGQEYLNPTLRIKTGQDFRARFQNALTEPSIIHWHGLHIPGDMDGQPRSVIDPGQKFEYAFNVPNRSGMYFYHSHPHHFTARQVYFGLSGILMVEDDDEIALRKALNLEPGVNELPLVLQDRQFNTAGELIYVPNTMQTHIGHLADTMLVNYTPRARLDIANGLYRFRILNASNSRIYKLAFMHRGRMLPYSVIGVDNGLLESPHTTEQEFIAPAERLDIIFDASAIPQGDEIFLTSLSFDPIQGGAPEGMGRMMGGVTGLGAMNGETLGLGAEFKIMRLVVTKQAAPQPREVPQRLSTIKRIDPSRSDSVRNVRISQNRMVWVINGESFDMDRFPLQSRSHTVELWDLEHAELSMPHPMHLHGFSFQVVSRRNSPEQVRKLARDNAGRQISDLGWKDTVLIWPGEVVRIAIDFTHSYKDKKDQQFLFHCHNLEHEDQGMMVNHLVRGNTQQTFG